eukprot:3394914-Pyramimonas_sp.AAC.1
MIPPYVAFGVEEGFFFKTLDSTTDCIFLLDIVLNFFTGYYDRGVIVMDQAMVANKYIRSWLWIDLVASVPVDLLSGSGHLSRSGVGYNDSLLRLHSMLRLLKMGTLARLQRVTQRLQLYTYCKNSFLTIVNI